jgi:hypothetical protein
MAKQDEQIKKDDPINEARETLARAVANLEDAAKEATARDRTAVNDAMAELQKALSALPDAKAAKAHCDAALRLAVIQDTYAADKAIVGLSVQQARFEITTVVTELRPLI